MKFYTPFVKTCLIAACPVIFCMQAQAATYTAVASGNFSNSATWGGLVPPTSVTSDLVIVPSGVTVTLDQNPSFSGSSTLLVNGTLNSQPAKTLVMTGGTLAGSGTINVDSMVLGSTSMAYTGAINAQNLTSTGTNLTTAATVTASEDLYLNGGTTDVSSGSLNIGNNGTIHMAGGSLMSSGTGSINLSTPYNVVYENASATTGAELNGSGLANVTVNVPSASSVTLGSDLNEKGTLTLNSGTLILNNHDLTFSGAGNVAAAGSGTISSNASSDITLSSGNLGGDLRFASGANTVNNLTINTGSSNTTAQLGSDLNVAGQLNLQNGKLSTGGHTLNVAGGASVTGGSANSYVVTGANGRLAMSLGAGASNTYQVGTNLHYAPITVAAATGSASATVGAGVMDSMYVHGATGGNLSVDQPVVNATWMLNSSAGSNINLSATPMWSNNMELNGFDRTDAYVAINTGGTWDVSTPGSSGTSGGLNTLTRSNITSSATAVAVADEGANTTGIKEIPASGTLAVYPNPATSTVTFNTTVNNVRADIYTVTGRLVRSAVLDNTHTLSVADLPAGLYNVRLSAKDFSSNQRFVKQ